MDAGQAIADLTEISSQVELVVLVGADGTVLASNADDDARARRLAEGAARLLDEADGDVRQLEAALAEGSVFVLREDGVTIAATTEPEPSSGLVLYDLKTALRSLDPPAPATPKKRAPRRRQEAGNGAA